MPKCKVLEAWSLHLTIDGPRNTEGFYIVVDDGMFPSIRFPENAELTIRREGRGPLILESEILSPSLQESANMTNAVVPVSSFNRKFWAILKNNAGWQGPYDSLEKAQQEAARLLARDGGWEQYFVVELVGTVMKPLPDMMWHKPDGGEPTALTDGTPKP